MTESIGTAQSSVATKRGLPLDYSNPGKAETVGALVERPCIFTYHEIQPEDSAYLYRVTDATLENHVSVVSSIRRNSLADAVPQITFDDGHRSNYEIAFPILSRFAVKATFFILAGRVGSNPQYVSWEQAREMASDGHCIGSHGWSHRMLTQCSSSELDRELSGAKREIEDRLGVEVDSISAPGGRWDERVVKACAVAGYKYFFHSNPWPSTSARNGILLQGRHMVTGQMDSQLLWKLMQIRGAKRQFLRARYAAKERFRLMLGDQLYHKLWCWLANWNPGEGVELEVNGHANGEAKKPL
jgi:peptidoglycan/xylan/chitin deacetylase (PgdA/CDA1 family)